MGSALDRRRFLKTASAAAGALAFAAARPGVEAEAQARRSADVQIGAEPYTPRDYPIAAKRHVEVTLRDDFWQPKVARNATVTIPFEVQKLDRQRTRLRRQRPRGRDPVPADAS